MTEAELLDELARRSGVAREQAEAVMSALASVACEQAQRGEALPLARFGTGPSSGRPETAGNEAAFVPGAGEVEELIAAAARHPLGLEFLVNGNLCAVATMFRVHAFTVDAARERLRQQGATAGRV